MKKNLQDNLANVYSFSKAKADRMTKDAYDLHINGFLDAAMALYRASIELYPTAKACTYLAWAYASRLEFQTAIELCQEALLLDPDFGNAYNDIGAYLIELGRDDEAVSYLIKAINSPTYDCRYFSYYNLGKLHLKYGRSNEAKDCFEKALDLKPEFSAARFELDSLG